MTKTKKPSKLVKDKADPNSRYWRNKADAAWSIVVRKPGCCLVCGATENLQAHHLINRWVLPLRHDPRNGICLCARHHKWDRQISAHQSPFGLAWILQPYAPDTWEWLMMLFHYWDETIAKKTNYQEAYNKLVKK